MVKNKYTGNALNVGGKLRDGPLENLSGGGGCGRNTKKKFAQGKI